MERPEFIRLAPDYYVAAAILAIRENDAAFSRRHIINFHNVRTSAGGSESLLSVSELLNVALDRLVQLGAIAKLDDPFGQTLYRKLNGFGNVVEQLKEDRSGPLYKDTLADDKGAWLRGALSTVNRRAREFKITADDFKGEEPDIWAPITLDQSEPLVKATIKELEAATNVIAQDNGYAATHPQERDAVVQDLTAGLEKFKSNEVSIAWIKRTVDALKLASGRFANTIKGQAIDGALAAVKEFVKTHASSAINYLWSFFV